MTNLLEALGVIALIGLIVALAFPSVFLGGEKAEVVYIGNLMKADLAQAAQESIINQSDLSVDFAADGYSLKIGEVSIDRRFNKYQFSFAVAGEEESDTESAEDMDGKSSKDTKSADSTDQESKNSENEETGLTEDAEDDSAEEGTTLKFAPSGLCSGISLGWTTAHFSGNLTVDQQGTVKWSYGQK